MQRILHIAALCLLFASGATARTGGGWVEDRGTGTVIHVKIFELPDPTRTDASTRSEAAIVRAFVKAFPTLFAERHAARAKAAPERYGRHNWDDVRVELFQATGLKVEKVESDLLPIAGGMAPDVLYVNFRKSDTYIQQGFLHPLDRPEDGYFASLTDEEKRLRIHPKIWPVIDRKGPGGRHVWALPYGDALGRVMAYRKDLFDQAGVPYPTADWTWDDLLAACRKLTDPERGLYGVHFGRNQHESWYWSTFLWSAGGEIMSYDDARDAWRIDFDSPQAVTALDFYTRLCTEKWTDARGRTRRGYAFKDSVSREVMNKWDNGEVAISFYHYLDERFFATVNPDVTGVVPVPRGPDGQRGAELNSKMMGLFSGIREPAVRDAAWEFIRFYQSPEAIRIKTQILVEGGLGRFVNPEHLALAGYEGLNRSAPPGWNDTWRIALETGRPEPYGRNSNYAYNLMTVPVQQAENLARNDQLPTGENERRAVLAGLLRTAAEKARREMLGSVPEETLQKRRWTAGVVLAALLLAAAFVVRHISRAFTPPSDPAGERTRGLDFRRFGIAYALLLPALLTTLVWQYWPLLRGSAMAFQDYRVIGDSRFVGLDNFGAVLWSRDWWVTVFNSLRYSFLVVALTFLPPTALAILLQETPRGRVLFRTLYYLPAVISGLVVTLLWRSFYDPSENGVLNAIVMRVPAIVFLLAGAGLLLLCLAFARRLHFHGSRFAALAFAGCGVLLLLAMAGLARPALLAGGPLWSRLLAGSPEPVGWLTDDRTAMLSCVIPMLWAGVGPGSLIYLAALKGISDDFYEAADIDGATFTDKVLFIIFPMLKPLLVINFVGVFIGAWLHGSANILAMTGGASGTEVADLHIFYEAFIYLRYGPATAMAWIMAFLLIGFTVQQLRMLARLEFRAAGKDE